MIFLFLLAIFWACYELSRRLRNRDKAAVHGNLPGVSAADIPSDADGRSLWSVLDDHQLNRLLALADGDQQEQRPQKSGPTNTRDL